MSLIRSNLSSKSVYFKYYAFSIIVIVATITIIFKGYFYDQSEKLNQCDRATNATTTVPFEIDPRFTLTDDKQVLFSGTRSDYYSFYKYDNSGNLTLLKGFVKNVFNPVIIAGQTVGLTDNNGNENFILTNKSISEFVRDEQIGSIFSYRNGSIVILHSSLSKSVYLIDILAKTRKHLISDVGKLHGACLTSNKSAVLLNYDSMLVHIDLQKGIKTQIAFNAESANMNAYLNKHTLYYSDNTNSEYFRLFSKDISRHDSSPTIIYSADHDLKMPKIRGRYLYFIEIANSEYLLKKINLETKTVSLLTRKGVTYNYDFLNDSIVIASYADLRTPRSLIEIDENNHTITNITGSEIDIDIVSELRPITKDRSSAYILRPPKKNTVKGIILYFHAGLHSDFSPRWDATLMDLCNNGYIIVAPNYPMSSGFGKSFFNVGMSTALLDINKWKKQIQLEFSGMPLYYLSSSSGNLLMEVCLDVDARGVKGAISLFGIPSRSKPGSLPSLFILGKNDPIVSYKKRLAWINNYNKGNMFVVSYPNEGHWIRSDKTVSDMTNKILQFLCYWK